MFKKGFLFPGLRYAGYEAGFSVRITTEMRRYSDLRFELILLRAGKRQHSVHLNIPPEPSLYFRSWESDWGFAHEENSSTDLYCLRIESPSHPEISLPPGSLEGQMMLRHLTYGWISTILTGFIPLRAPGHRFAPIIHTGHCMASVSDTETLNLFMNVKNIEDTELSNGGTLTAYVYDREGTHLGTAHYPVIANATVAISYDAVTRDCNIKDSVLQNGINIKFHGGESQFAILTLFRHRLSGSIALEHTLAPIYYIPDLTNPATRSLVYSQLEAKL